VPFCRKIILAAFYVWSISTGRFGACFCHWNLSLNANLRTGCFPVKQVRWLCLRAYYKISFVRVQRVCDARAEAKLMDITSWEDSSPCYFYMNESISGPDFIVMSAFPRAIGIHFRASKECGVMLMSISSYTPGNNFDRLLMGRRMLTGSFLSWNHAFQYSPTLKFGQPVLSAEVIKITKRGALRWLAS